MHNNNTNFSAIQEELENFSSHKVYPINGEAKPRKESTKKLPFIIQVENFLHEHFEFRHNAINEKIEYKSIGVEGEWKEANENVISRFLEHNHFKYSPTKTLALLCSDFVPSYN